MDPEMAKYFKKILNSFSMGLIWMMSAAIAGFYYGLALFNDGVQWYNLVFYAFFLLSFAGPKVQQAIKLLTGLLAFGSLLSLFISSYQQKEISASLLIVALFCGMVS